MNNSLGNCISSEKVQLLLLLILLYNIHVRMHNLYNALLLSQLNIACVAYVVVHTYVGK